MGKPFLLRFQEPTEETSLADVRCGAQTGTRMEAQQADSDRSGHDHVVIPRAGGFADASTEQIRANRSDAAANASVVMGTLTKTAVRAESPMRTPAGEITRFFRDAPRTNQ